MSWSKLNLNFTNWNLRLWLKNFHGRNHLFHLHWIWPNPLDGKFDWCHNQSNNPFLFHWNYSSIVRFWRGCRNDFYRLEMSQPFHILKPMTWLGMCNLFDDRVRCFCPFLKKGRFWNYLGPFGLSKTCLVTLYNYIPVIFLQLLVSHALENVVYPLSVQKVALLSSSFWFKMPHFFQSSFQE